MDFKTFDMNQLKQQTGLPTIIVLKTNSGRSCLAKDIMHLYQDIPYATVI